MTTPKQDETLKLYQTLMTEARYRLEAFNHILSGQTGLAEALIMELCYLQLRMLCETIAIGCLVLHEGISEIAMNKKLANEWHAEKIIDALETLSPLFFPQPVDVNTKTKHIQGGKKPNAIERDEVVKLYSICGQMLHRGTAKKLLNHKSVPYKQLDAAEIVGWGQKIEDLLSTHLIMSFGGDVCVLCILRDENRNTKTFILEDTGRPGQPPPEQT